MEDARSTRQQVDDLIRRHRSGSGVVGALESLCRAMAEDLELIGAVVTLMPSVGAHAVSACSSTAARQVEEAQFGVGEGPTRDAFTSRRPVLVGELETVGVRRWPGWAPAALAAGASAAYAFPLQVGASIFGVLTAYVGSGPRLHGRRLETALVFSEAATERLLDWSAAPDGDGLGPDLEATLANNGHIYQAQGKVMVELGITLPEAMARMRALAWSSGKDLSELAREILDGRTMPTRDPR